MTTVYKYPLAVTDEQTVEMPAGVILTVQVQHGTPCLWAAVDPSSPMTKRVIRIAGTGHLIDDSIATHRYIGTFQLAGGALVFHAFEVLP